VLQRVKTAVLSNGEFHINFFLSSVLIVRFANRFLVSVQREGSAPCGRLTLQFSCGQHTAAIADHLMVIHLIIAHIGDVSEHVQERQLAH
jgi:hypothetical protein